MWKFAGGYPTTKYSRLLCDCIKDYVMEKRYFGIRILIIKTKKMNNFFHQFPNDSFLLIDYSSCSEEVFSITLRVRRVISVELMDINGSVATCCQTD